MRLRSILAGCVALLALVATGASAQNCVGFTDVPASNPFCLNVEWLKNRAVTTGCGAGTTYCPNDNVTRLQMAIFMNRLGTALTPVSLAATPVDATPVTLSDSPATICQTADFAISGATQAFPRRAYVYGTTNLSQPSAAGVDIRADIAYSTNGGASWTYVTYSDHYASLYSGATPGNHTTLAPFGWVDLDVGQTVRFALRLWRFGGTGNIVASCALNATIGNRNAPTSPL